VNKVLITIPVYITNQLNQDLLIKCIQSLGECDVLLVVNRWDEPFNDNFYSNDELSFESITIERRLTNSIAGAWRDGFIHANRFGYEKVYFINQDIEFESIEAFNAFVKPELNSAALGESNRYSAWGGDLIYLDYINAELTLCMGAGEGIFDDQFTAYFEDNDIAYKLKLLGIDPPKTIEAARVKHYGSSVIKASESDKKATEKVFQASQARYIAKWGGMPRKERFTKPFNK